MQSAQLPKERRSNRRPPPNTDVPEPKSSRSPEPLPAPRDLTLSDPSSSTHPHPAHHSSSASLDGRSKRSKDRDSTDDSMPIPDDNDQLTSASSRRKRRGAKDSLKDHADFPVEPLPHQPPLLTNGDSESHLDLGENDDLDDDAGITRCVCGANGEEDADAGEFMIQCELCKVWQHGPCMGFPSEEEASKGDYYCEECKPDQHVNLLKRLKRQRQTSSHTNPRAASRSSRSHSPTHMLKNSRRRNTMNSREAAAYEESLQEVLDASVLDTGPGGEPPLKDSPSVVGDSLLDHGEAEIGSRRKRKRTDDETSSTKRKRSASNASELPLASASADTRNEGFGGSSVPPLVSPIDLPPPPPLTKSNSSRAKRGHNRKTNANANANSSNHTSNANNSSANANAGANAMDALATEGDEGSTVGVGSLNSKKHPNQYTYRGKTVTQLRRGPAAHASQSPNGKPLHILESSSHTQPINNPSRSSHYAASNNNIQQPLFTSWGLPDYLAHLQHILPSDVPAALTIQASSLAAPVRSGGVWTFEGAGSGSGKHKRGAGAGAGTDGVGAGDGGANGVNGGANVNGSVHSNANGEMEGNVSVVVERGVKVKWPAKRMSVADMNKRVRSLVESVGREQAGALERERRKAALGREVVGLGLSGVPSVGEAEEVVGVAANGRLTNGKTSAKDDASSNGAMDVDTIDSSEASNHTPNPNATNTKTNHSSTPTPILPYPILSKPILTPTITDPASESRQLTMKMMEELMEELISFQERFGPGAKGRARLAKVGAS